MIKSTNTGFVIPSEAVAGSAAPSLSSRSHGVSEASATTPKPGLLLLTFLVLVVHGYHPLADDGAVYVAGIKKLLDHGLYCADAVFALSPTRLSIFPHAVAALVGSTHLPLSTVLLLGHLASIFLFLAGCSRLAKALFSSPSAQWGALLLAACCFTLPVAGTSLSIMDPYVTARSFSTPLGLFAVASALEERYRASVMWLGLTGLVHPLMGAYTAICTVATALAQRRKWRLLTGFCALGWSAAASVFLLSRNTDLQAAWSQAALSRSYFFLSSWQWYEYLGLGMPLLLLATLAARVPLSDAARALTIAVTSTGATSLLTCICFVHRTGSLWLARLQMLRSFQWVYLAGALLAGGVMGAVALRHRRALLALYTCIALAHFAGQRTRYPHSNHLEWPWSPVRNQYQQAFLWIRGHAPNDALFALDNDYIEAQGEDAQGFRATAERSTVPDYFKDGGIAANFPQAAEAWELGSQATANLNGETDAKRVMHLAPLGVTWIVLPASSATALDCPYQNPGVRVCRLRILLHKAEGAK